MAQKEKELLLRDLCARLLYDVICQSPSGMKFTLKELNPKQSTRYGEGCVHDFDGKTYYIGHIVPYLRPLSSMTEEEMSELSNLNSGLVFRKNIIKNIILDVYYKTDAIDWLNKHHFDYRGLIEKGLALQAPEGMY